MYPENTIHVNTERKDSKSALTGFVAAVAAAPPWSTLMRHGTSFVSVSVSCVMRYGSACGIFGILKLLSKCRNFVEKSP